MTNLIPRKSADCHCGRHHCGNLFGRHAGRVPPLRDQFAPAGRVAVQPIQFSRLLPRGVVARVADAETAHPVVVGETSRRSNFIGRRELTARCRSPWSPIEPIR